MGKRVRCKVCGYVMRADRLGEICPACGAQRKVFEPYEDPLSPERRRWLELDLHPIAVHFPVAFSASLVALAALPLLIAGQARELLIHTAQILSLVTPLLVAAAFLTGLADGKTRFRRVNRSPFLRRKILYGIALFVFSTGLAPLIWLGSLRMAALGAVTILVAAGALLFAFLQGLIGKQLLNAAFPGR